MKARAAVVALACLTITTAAAQPAPSMEQVAPPAAGHRAAIGISQVSPAPVRDRTAVSQLEKGLSDKGLGAAAPVSATPAAEFAIEGALALSRARSDSVDADEIARLLETGEAASIDAAAAIATTTVRARPVAEDLSERAARARQMQGAGR